MHNLFKTGTREWDEDIVKDLFNARDRLAISEIVLCRNQCSDTRYWSYEQSGNYAVKSAYKLLQNISESWAETDEVKVWKSL